MKLGERRGGVHTSTDGTSSIQGCPRFHEHLMDADVIEKMLDVLRWEFEQGVWLDDGVQEPRTSASEPEYGGGQEDAR